MVCRSSGPRSSCCSSAAASIRHAPSGRSTTSGAAGSCPLARCVARSTSSPRRVANGVRVLRELLDERGDDYVPPASSLEGSFAEVLERAGQTPMRRQVDSGGDRWVGRVDFRDEDLPLLVEVQSETYHLALTDARDDEVRLAALRGAGFEVVEVTDAQVWHRPDEVVDAVCEARCRLREQPAFVRGSGRSSSRSREQNQNPEGRQ